MRICSYLNLKGNALPALKFYGEIFRTKPEYMTYAEMPPCPDFPVTEATKGLVLHGELFLDKEQSIMIADDMREGEGIMGNALSLALLMDDAAEQRRIFTALAEGGTILMPLEKTFWTSLFGSVKDRFGVIWSLNLCEEPEST